jgi:hypothetical protein
MDSGFLKEVAAITLGVVAGVIIANLLSSKLGGSGQ